MKRVLKSMGWAIFGLMALVVDVVAVLHVPEGREFIRFMVERKVAENFRGDVELGSLDMDLSGSLGLGDLRFKSGEDELLHIENVRVELDGAPSDGLIDVALIEVNGVHVRQGEGLPRLDTLFIPPEPEETPPAFEERVNIRSIRISDVNVEDYRLTERSLRSANYNWRERPVSRRVRRPSMYRFPRVRDGRKFVGRTGEHSGFPC